MGRIIKNSTGDNCNSRNRLRDKRKDWSSYLMVSNLKRGRSKMNG